MINPELLLPMFKDIQILSDSLDLEQIFQQSSSPAAGAVDIFVGTVRNQTKGKSVVRLEFESYTPMAIKEMDKIAEEAASKWPIEKITIHHRVGNLTIGEIAVIIAVSTPHRKASFEACNLSSIP